MPGAAEPKDAVSDKPASPAGSGALRPLAALELALAATEVGLVALPLYLLTGDELWASGALPLLVPFAAGLIALAIVGDRILLRPLRVALEAKHRKLPVSPELAETVRRTVVRAPLEAGALRIAVWICVAVLAAVHLVRIGAIPKVAALGFASMALLQGAAAAALRSLAWDRPLENVRRTVLPNFDPLRAFASTYRLRLARIAVATLGVSHAVTVALVSVFTSLSARQAATMLAFVFPALLPGLVFWTRSLRRRTGTIERYFDAALRSPSVRGPARDDPRAVAAFKSGQSIPYRLAAYQSVWSALAGLAVISAGRRIVGFDTPTAGRLLGALALIVLAMGLYETLLLRDVLRPLLGQLGARHRLPVVDVRAAPSLKGKLVAFFLMMTVLTSGLVALFALSPIRRLPSLFGSVGLALAVALGLVLLIVRDIVGPIRALEERTEEMARGELARPVPPSGEADEVGRLTFAFEEMRRALRDKLRSTESLNIDLEREVRRRTEVLEQRNAELRDALEKLRRAQDDLIRSEKLASMGRLVAGIAHEINNPVNAVINTIGPLEELIRTLPAASDAAAVSELAAQANEMLGVIQRGAARSKAIVQALHNYSRGDDEVPREVNLARSVDDTVDLLRHRLKNVHVERDVDPGLRIVGFAGQIDQVLMNLLTNAAQAIGERPSGGTIRLAAHGDAERVVMTIADDGPGIPPAVLPRIFDPFFTTKDVGEGSGLGLSIVHGIIERHGGKISVDSALGQGTTFTIHLPRQGAANVA